MPRHLRTFKQIPAATPYYLLATFWISVLLSICHIPNANATIAAHIGGAAPAAKTKDLSLNKPAGYCDDRYYDCKGRRTAAHYDTTSAETYADSYESKPDHYEKPVEIECRDTYVTVEELPLPDDYDHDSYGGRYCGVRCWYKRLTSGYCGRGCDYYLYRLGKHYNPCKYRH